MKMPQRGFLRVDIQQMLDADQIIWRHLAKSTRDGIKRRNAATRPLDDCIMKVLDCLDVQMALLQRQGAVQAAPQPAIDYGPKIVKDLQKQIDALHATPSCRLQACASYQ